MRLIDKLNNLRIKTREYLNPYLGRYRRRKLVRTGFTIISNNCWGGHVYRYYNLPYDSPTVGLYIYTADYLKFVSNLEKYISTDLHFIDYTESKYEDDIVRNNQQNVPIGRLDDVEIMFLHYKTREEAAEKWNRRKQRIHRDNLYFKMSEQNLCSEEYLKKFDALPTDKKFVFVTKDYGLKSQIIFKDFEGQEYIPNDTTEFRKFINITKWLNGEPFKLKQ